MKEYIGLKEEKAQKRRKVFNKEIANYGKIWYDENVYDLRSVAMEFPAILFNDNLTSNETLSCEPRNVVEAKSWLFHPEIRRTSTLGTTPSYTLISDPTLRLCHRLIACSITRRSMVPKKVVVTDLFYLRGMDVGSINVLYLLASYLRLFALGKKQGVMISDGTTPSYTLISDPKLRLCHRLIACSITRRSMVPKKVVVTDLFYLRGMDVGSINVLYLLASYLRLFALGKKQGVMISDASRTERQPDAMVGAPEAAEDAPVPQPPPPIAGQARTMA
nr:hypothetical protein [Tanacetum cinerariifolium]